RRHAWNTGPHSYAGCGITKGGEHRHFGRPYLVALFRDQLARLNLACSWSYELAGSHGLPDENLVAGLSGDFDHLNGVGAMRHRRSGKDLDRLACSNVALK